MKFKFRVILPVAFPSDGVVHQFGEIVELEAEEAALYSHALILVDDEGKDE